MTNVHLERQMDLTKELKNLLQQKQTNRQIPEWIQVRFTLLLQPCSISLVLQSHTQSVVSVCKYDGYQVHTKLHNQKYAQVQ